MSALCQKQTFCSAAKCPSCTGQTRRSSSAASHLMAHGAVPVMRTELRAIAAKMASCQRGMRLRGALIQIKDSTPITPNQCPLSRIKRTSSRPGEMSAFTARFAERPARRTSCQNHHVKLTDAVSETRRN